MIETGFVSVMIFGTRGGAIGVTATGDFNGADLVLTEREGEASAGGVGTQLVCLFHRWRYVSA